MVGQVIRIAVLVAHILGLSLQSEAQNIVPNGGFEDISDCPLNGGSIWLAEPWRSSRNSADLYNVCGDFGYSVPENRNGYQESYNRDGYAGFATYSDYPGFNNAREFVKCPLNYSLQEGQDYYVQAYVSQADSLQYATHNIGITFTQVDTGEFGELVCWPGCDIYLENTAANPLTSKTEWMKISGTFTAQGGERYLHIGNFRTDEDSEIEFVGGGTDPNVVWNQAYYYIDDVWLSHIDSMGYVSVNEQLQMRNEQYLVYPNPATDVLNVDGLDPSTALRVTVVDFSGRKILTTPSHSLQGGGLMQLDVSGWAAGVYLLSVRDENGNVVSKRVVKE